MRGIARPAIVTSVKAIRYYRYGSPETRRILVPDGVLVVVGV